ncbi:MAG TPA: DUF4159 domain-containing protein [Gammaproteobacteria bacterium]
MPRFADKLAALAAVLLCTLTHGGPRADDAEPDAAEFHFARLAFGAFGSRFGIGRGEPWLRDWPDADYHFMQGVRRLTRIDAADGSRQVGLLGEDLFDYPVIYAVKVGFMRLDDREAAQLREYLLRGGFLIVDDFHGPAEWDEFAASMARVFPDRPILDMPDADEVFHVLYDLDQRVQIPGRQAVLSGVTWEHPQGVPARWRGIYDDDGRLMIAINFNMDLGDAWEHADDAFYPEPLTALAYRFGVNYLVYAITH